MSLKAYIQAARLRTLPLAVAGSIAGNLLAYSESGALDVWVFVLSLLTAVLLQILSNYANDYGDFVNGADGPERTDRVSVSGKISLKGMKTAIAVLTMLCLLSGISLLLYGVQETDSAFWILLGTGLLGIAAAYFYTAGKRPYGYSGYGDLAVFLFFGLLAVMGTFYLQTHSLDSRIWLVAAAIGLLSTGVLNVNNIRDIESDKSKDKITIAVLLGYRKALYYQLFLLYTAVALLTIYSIFSIKPGIILISNYLIFSLLFYLHYEALKACRSREEYNRQLKMLSLLILGLMLYFCFSDILFKPVWD